MAIVHDAPCHCAVRRGLLIGPPAWLAGGQFAAHAQTRPASPVLIGGTGTGLAPLHRLAGALNLGMGFVPNLGSGGGIKALLAGAIDIALAARPLGEAERAAGLMDRPWFRTPFVWAVHAAVPIQRTTVAELAAIYAGRTERWANGDIVRLVLRPESDSDTQLMRGAHPDLAQALALAARRPGMRVAVTDDEAIADIERIAGALGTTSLAMVRSQRRVAKVPELDGVAPDTDTMADGRYRLAKTIHLISRATPGVEVQAVLKALAAPAARDVLLQLGCVPVAAG